MEDRGLHKSLPKHLLHALLLLSKCEIEVFTGYQRRTSFFPQTLMISQAVFAFFFRHDDGGMRLLQGMSEGRRSSRKLHDVEEE